jgi:hypothetical protein
VLLFLLRFIVKRDISGKSILLSTWYFLVFYNSFTELLTYRYCCYRSNTFMERIVYTSIRDKLRFFWKYFEMMLRISINVNLTDFFVYIRILWFRYKHWNMTYFLRVRKCIEFQGRNVEFINLKMYSLFTLALVSTFKAVLTRYY